MWDHLPQAHPGAVDREEDQVLRDRRLQGRATQTGMGGRVNTIMQTCFFAISGVLPREQAIEAIKNSIKKTYGRKGDQVVQQNFAGGRSDPRQSARSEGARQRSPARSRCPRWSPTQAPEFVQERDGTDHRRVRRRSAGQRHAGGRHIPDGHDAVGEAEYRAGNPGVGYR